MVIVSCCGCDDGRPATYPVQGSVHFDDGWPVFTGIVEFRSKVDGRHAKGKIDAGGKFTLGTFSNDDGAVAGEHQVVVIQHFDPAVWQGGIRNAGPLFSDESTHDHEFLLVDPRYGAYATCGLTANVKPQSKNEIEVVVGEPVRRAAAGSQRSGRERPKK